MIDTQFEIIDGIAYKRPTVVILQETGIGTSEFAARSAYDSFEKSENNAIKNINTIIKGIEDDDEIYSELDFMENKNKMNDIQESKLLNDLAWTYFHHSVLEHASITYSINGISRGVLQELARHRIASYTVRSTRYTMGTVINIFNASLKTKFKLEWFIRKMIQENILVTQGYMYQELEWESVFNKLLYQKSNITEENWYALTVSKQLIDEFIKIEEPKEALSLLENGPKKRNIGDSFKHIVTDNWKVDLVMTMNLRSLKNFLKLRDTGAAWFQIRWLAEEIKKQTPKKYLQLIIKK